MSKNVLLLYWIPSLKLSENLKRNQHVQMDQFLGFSYEQSSLVTNIKNLRAGHISPQYHIVLDDLFQTVFRSSENYTLVDVICNQLFESNWDEFSAEAECIYSYPPSDEIWLSEPEPWDRKEKTQAQCNSHEENKFNWVHHIPAPIPLHSPPDVDVFSDDDSSVNSSSHVKLSESKGGIWPDHLKVANDADCDCDSVLTIGPNVVSPDLDPSTPVIAPERDYHESPLTKVDDNNVPGKKDSGLNKVMAGSNG